MSDRQQGSVRKPNFAEVRREIVEDNVAKRGVELLTHLTFVMLSSAVAMCVCVWGDATTKDICEVRGWFRGMWILQGVSVATIFLLQCALTTLLGRFATDGFTEDAGVLGRATPQQPRPSEASEPSPGPPEPPAPAPPEQEDILSTGEQCWLWQLASSTVMLLMLVVVILLWTVLGLVSVWSLGEEEDCSSARATMFGTSLGVLCQTCLCHCCSLAGTHQDRRVAGGRAEAAREAAAV